MFGLGLGRLGLSGAKRSGAAWTPAAYFELGEQGAWYDPSDLTTLFQDAGTTPVTSDGQTVALMKDKSGNGNDMTLVNCKYGVTNAGRGFIYQTSAGSCNTASFAMGSDKITAFAAFQPLVSDGTLISNGNITTQQGTFDFGAFSGKVGLYLRGDGAWGARVTAAFTGFYATVSSFEIDLSGTTADTECPTLRDNLAQGLLTNYGAANSGGGNFETYPLTLFNGQGGFIGNLFQLIIRSTLSTDDEITDGETYCVSKCGPPLAFTMTPTSFNDTGAAVDMGGYYLTSSFASLDFDTEATEIEVAILDDAAYYVSVTDGISVYVDGVWQAVLSNSPRENNSFRIPLPGGNKRIKVVNGLATYQAGAVRGTYVTKVKANAAMAQVTLPGSNRVLIYGDSIAVGGNSTLGSRDGWPVLLREAYSPDSVALEAWGYRALHDDCIDATARTAFAAIMAAYSPSRIWIAIGTNDYGLNLWDAASFGAAYAAMLDALHTSMPSVSIFCQTPLLRSSETANGSGSTTGDYRTQIATAVSTRTSYCTLVDGTAIMTTGSLADGVHPTTAGHALYADYVQTVLGI